MKHVFYALIIIQALYELAKLFRCKSLYRHVKVFQKLDKASKRWYLMAHPWLHVAFFMDTIGLLLLGMGLFSSQWVCFLVVLIMSFSQIQKLGAWAVFLDSLVTVIIYAFAILNAYHLA
jgi:hypothetical protein|nr:MAG TPA: hypothetical protein [Caudoviricetes sp.]